MKKFNIAIVDDHKLFRAGLITLLEDLDFVKNIYEAANGIEFLKLIKEIKVDVALMDIDMPEMNGVETTKKAIEFNPDIKIISLSMYGDDEYYLNMINAGVMGFLLKDSDIDEVEKAIITVGNGEKYFSSERLYDILLSSRLNIPKQNILTDRETEVLGLICKGLSNQEIAKKLFLSKRTIDKHRENILSKTNCHNTASLIMYANKNNLIQN